ncbi:hypothetical protein ACWCYL_42655 [Streptomyces sp. 900105755]
MAIATLVLAGFTWRLAARTRQLAEETADDQRAQWRPVILPCIDRPTLATTGLGVVMQVLKGWVATGKPIHYNKDLGFLGIACRNAGRGPALHVRAQLEVTGAPERINPTYFSMAAVAPGDEAQLLFDLAELGSPIQLLLDYRDLGGRHHAAAITIETTGEAPYFHDVRIWESHSVTSKADPPYPPPGLSNAAPPPRPTWLSPDWDGTMQRSDEG